MRSKAFLAIAAAGILVGLFTVRSVLGDQARTGPGLFIDAGCANITNPVTGATWCFDSTNDELKYWDGSAFTSIIANVTGFPLQTTGDFNNYSGKNIDALTLDALSAPTGLAATATCSGTCATTYTYEVTCAGDNGTETLPSSSVTATNASSLSASNNVALAWTADSKCHGGYNVYGRVSGSLGLLATVTSASYTDTGSASPGASPPSANTTGVIILKGSTSGQATLGVPAAAGTPTFNFPTSDGTSGQFLQTDGAGNWSPATVSAFYFGASCFLETSVCDAPVQGVPLAVMKAPRDITFDGGEIGYSGWSCTTFPVITVYDSTAGAKILQTTLTTGNIPSEAMSAGTQSTAASGDVVIIADDAASSCSAYGTLTVGATYH